MDAERSEASQIYHDRAEELAIDVEIKRDITRHDLAGVFETPVEFVDFIGHCDDQGIRCTDGHLMIEDIETSRARMFFLNACGSYREGLELVRRGSIAGGVTLDEVLDDQATAVGIAFARLVVSGCSIALALRLASNQTIVSKNYAVVGDGTHSISQGFGQYPARVTDGPGDSFRVTGDMLSVRDHGSVFQSYLTESDSKILLGNDVTHSISEEQLLEHLRIADAPVIYHGELYWSDGLWRDLSHDHE